MEATVALIPQAFASSQSTEALVRAPMDVESRQPLLVPDAFSNPAHLRFALRGTLAAASCYVVYTSIAWTGLSTSIPTCIITALSTIGSSRQKQFLRLAGAIVGGLIFGIGAQVFVLPHLDSIAGFTLLFAVVTAISAWIATATPRLSYMGVQVASGLLSRSICRNSRFRLHSASPGIASLEFCWACCSHVAHLRPVVG